MHTFDDIQEIKGSDENVIKFIFETKGDSPAIFEAVLYKYPTYLERTVMCISTQSGCPMGCSFCGTGKFYNRNATADEMIEQVAVMATRHGIELNKVKKLQIMLMSMGEPLLNADEVCAALPFFHRSVPTAELLISTAAPKTAFGWDMIMDAAVDIPTIGLQFSVHASNDVERDKIMPMKGKLCLEEIALKGLEFYQRTGRKPFFNYCVHAGNCDSNRALELRMLFDPRIWECTLSVVCEPEESMSDIVRESTDLINEFSSDMVGLGFNTRIFDPAGQDDIGGGCGQLWQVQQYAEKNPSIMKQSAGNKCLEKRINIAASNDD